MFSFKNTNELLLFVISATISLIRLLQTSTRGKQLIGNDDEGNLARMTSGHSEAREAILP